MFGTMRVVSRFNRYVNIGLAADKGKTILEYQHNLIASLQ